MKSFYITGATGWILSYLSQDIALELQRRGYASRMGNYDDYKGEDCVLQMWWRQALPYKEAKHNSVFVTHIDDIAKEKDLLRMKDSFDSFICMSHEDANFLLELGFDKGKVFGMTLPIRNSYIRPLSIGIFSNCYPDGRKNEKWILDFCNENKDSNLINFVFLGDGWGEICNSLKSLGCSFEWHCASRTLPYEYFFQQNKLTQLDYYLYVGMDGGAMGTYDAYAMGTSLCISDDGYHKDIPTIDYKFETKEEFFDCLKLIVSRQRKKLQFFQDNCIKNYVDKLIAIWTKNSLIKTEELPTSKNFDSVLEKRRYNYSTLSFSRFIQPLSSHLHKCRKRMKYNRSK